MLGRARSMVLVGALVSAGALAGARAAAGGPPPLVWSSAVGSPAPLDETSLTALELRALERCGPGERSLRETARAVLARRLAGARSPDVDVLAFVQRAAGDPHPWARVWMRAGPDADAGSSIAELDAWLAASPPESRRRCGVATAMTEGGLRALAVVSVDALADLAPLPVRVRAGQWLAVEARLNVPSRGAWVVVLGPSGTPRRVPATLDGGIVRARFAPESRGAFVVQVVADLASGAQPVLEAMLFAGCEPPEQPEWGPAPGEGATDPLAPPDVQLAGWLNTARATAALGPLVRDPDLDAVASAHAVQMARRHRLAHDAGDGDPAERLRRAGIAAAYLGENVAHARTLALAHRAIWASPSHRANVLRSEYRRTGVAAVRDDDGDWWAVEAFAGD